MIWAEILVTADRGWSREAWQIPTETGLVQVVRPAQWVIPRVWNWAIPAQISIPPLVC